MTNIIELNNRHSEIFFKLKFEREILTEREIAALEGELAGIEYLISEMDNT